MDSQRVDEVLYSTLLKITRERLGQATIALTEVEAMLEIEREANKVLLERLAQYEPQQGSN